MDDLFNLLSLEAPELSADPLSAPTLASVPTSSPIPVDGDRADSRYGYGSFCVIS
uniref:Pheromone n=1 Tax=Agrocybe salicacicola TaxID=1078488 RepID=A0A2P0M889_9AGAR|nr:pheromone precursor [Agrocybe salicacicola]